MLINVTRRAVDSFSVDVGEFVVENDHILEEIDMIIASLGDIHTRINTVISKFGKHSIILRVCAYSD